MAQGVEADAHQRLEGCVWSAAEVDLGVGRRVAGQPDAHHAPAVLAVSEQLSQPRCAGGRQVLRDPRHDREVEGEAVVVVGQRALQRDRADLQRQRLLGQPALDLFPGRRRPVAVETPTLGGLRPAGQFLKARRLRIGPGRDRRRQLEDTVGRCTPPVAGELP